MSSVGIRELRQDASSYVRRAAAGEQITVTDRGRPVAKLVPLTDADATLSALAALGARLPERPRARVTPVPGLSLSALLQAEREERL